MECQCVVKNTDQKQSISRLVDILHLHVRLWKMNQANDYYVEFEKEETLDQKVIDVAHRAMSRTTKPFLIMKNVSL